MPNKNNTKIYNSLKNEVILLHSKWTVYKSLFEFNEQRLNLLKDVVPLLAVFFQKMLLDDIAITICRILDPKQTGKHDNNTLYQLFDSDSPCIEDLRDLSVKTKPLRDNRNKFLAHRDLQETLDLFAINTDNGTTSLDLNFPLSVQKVDEILAKIQSLLNHAGEANMLYGHINTPFGPDLGVKKLIDTLKTGAFYKKMESDNRINSTDFIEELANFEHKDA